MKKFTLFLLAAMFLTATTMAQKGPERVVKLPAAKMEQLKKFTSQQPKQLRKSALQKQRGQLTAQDARALFAGSRTGLPKMAWQKAKAPRKADMISDRPEGEYKLYERNGDSYFYSWFGVYYNQAVGKVCEVVFAEGGKVYLKNIISQMVLPGWIEGTISGSKITFDMPQAVFSSDGDEYYAMVGAFDEQEMTYVSTNNALTLDYDATTGVISTPQDGDFATGNAVVGLFEGDGFWTGYADWNFTMTVITEKTVETPARLDTSMFQVTADGFPGTIAYVGFTGNDVYVQGIFPDMPEAWVKGTIEGNKAVFKNGQFLGADLVNGCVQYLISATAETTLVEDPEWGDYTETVYFVGDEDIVFDYDAETQTFTGTNLFMVNAGTKEINYGAIYENAVIKPFIEVAATPLAPEDLYITEYSYDYYTYGYGWGYLDFMMHCADEDGNYILPDKLSYQLWVRVNGEEMPLTLSHYDYANLDEDMTEVPYAFTDNWDISSVDASHGIYYYVLGPEAYGVQAIYRGLGEERRSEIVWAEVYGPGAEIQPDAATPDYPEVDPTNVGGSITYGTYTGNESRVTFGEWEPQTYDVAMKLQDDAIVGTYIEDITFNLKTVRGLSNLKVWLSSQLRVENGENVPDLVSIDVAMPSRAGDVTVKLDKPYTIPAEGVFVGYSFTISESAYSSANDPVTIVDEVKPAGFYVHSSTGILKWIDMSEMVGCSACINVTLGGSLVKANAVTPTEGENSYVLTGSDISVTLPFLSHGSEGVKSMDIEYTFNGTTATKHIDLDSPVDGFLGQTFTYDLDLPAISEKGTYELTVNVLKVNGMDNEDDVTTASTTVFVINTLPKHRALLEEYTGTWCGWCPRGFVALELLKEQYPDEFVCVSYHNGDPMEITEYFPSAVGGFPSAFVDRGMEVDPFYGLSEEGFGVLDVLQWRNTMFGTADLALEATLSEESNTVDVKCDVIFPFTDDNVNYTLEYLLVEDGLTGESSDWAQSNYYAGMEAEEELSFFTSGESTISGLVFNDVVVMQSEMGGIYESLPAAVTADQPVSHTYTFELDNAVNTGWEPIIQDNSKLFVVAMLINSETGEVCNAIKVPVGSATVGIHSVDNSTISQSNRCYDLMGRQWSNGKLSKGLYIVNGRKVVK